MTTHIVQALEVFGLAYTALALGVCFLHEYRKYHVRNLLALPEGVKKDASGVDVGGETVGLGEDYLPSLVPGRSGADLTPSTADAFGEPKVAHHRTSRTVVFAHKNIRGLYVLVYEPSPVHTV